MRDSFGLSLAQDFLSPSVGPSAGEIYHGWYVAPMTRGKDKCMFESEGYTVIFNIIHPSL